MTPHDFRRGGEAGTHTPRTLDTGLRADAPTGNSAQSDVPQSVADGIRATTAHLIALDTRIGAEFLVPAAVRAATAARRTARRDPESGRDTLAAAAEANQVAGWITYDAEHQTLSRHLSREAFVLARTAGDRPLAHFALSQLAMQNVHLRQPVEAEHICDTALQETRRGSVRTLFTLRKARAAAQQGDHTRARELIGRTYSSHQDGPRRGDPSWTWWLTEAEIAWHHAMIHADADDWDGTIERFSAATEHPAGYERAVFVAQTSLLWALARAGAWTDAEAVLVNDVLPLQGTVGSVRSARLLAETRHILDRVHSRPTLRETARQLAPHHEWPHSASQGGDRRRRPGAG
ncbi:DNA-binding protein [Spiractinospora alimapuensis]|uniref:DNA-binding protein n=1 Tax=Spiractinospora alimapuensis TaxID=2820884 RepID=UPI001F2B2C01|nr:DNA-binding protein [Spiractinospora alimapuensis]QVQ54172.1 DNA-binding protein [Spiractinospora alimapuensis]